MPAMREIERIDVSPDEGEDAKSDGGEGVDRASERGGHERCCWNYCRWEWLSSLDLSPALWEKLRPSGFTWAFGRAEASFDAAIYGMAEAAPLQKTRLA